METGLQLISCVVLPFRRCSAPEEYAGQSISSLVDVKSIQNCSNPPMEGHWTDGEDILPLPPKMYTGFSARLLILYLFGIMFIIIGVSILVMMFVRSVCRFLFSL